MGAQPIKRQRRANRKQDQALVDITEREKQIMARQLHEGLLQTLSAASILSRVVAMRAKETTSLPAPEFTRLQETIDSAIDEARLLIRQLQPPDLERKALVAALQDLVGSVPGKCACEFTCGAPNNAQASSATGVALLRVAQEAVKRALQRRQVSHISVSLTASGPGLKLVVNDNGSAPPPELENFAAQGMRLMQSYASLVGGELTTQSSSHGTIVTFICPD
jgi:signal transduction histidine kinase